MPPSGGSSALIAQPSPKILGIVFVTLQLSELREGSEIAEKDGFQSRKIQHPRQIVSWVEACLTRKAHAEHNPIVLVTWLHEGWPGRRAYFGPKIVNHPVPQLTRRRRVAGVGCKRRLSFGRNSSLIHQVECHSSVFG